MDYNDNSALGVSLGEMQGWEDHPVTVRYLAWLRHRLDYHRRSVEELLVKGDEKARAAAGAVMAYREIISAIEDRPKEAPKVEEEPFVDPAARVR